AFLIDFLTSGAQPQADIQKAAEYAGHSSRTLQRAKSALGIKSRKRADGWWWELPQKKKTAPGLFGLQESQGRQERQDAKVLNIGKHDQLASDQFEDCQEMHADSIGDLGKVGDVEACPGGNGSLLE
ncbi:MAG: hypothetical protein ABL893_21285, partial [Hyphomicrobium sp.]